jgi:hypothetical protein
VIFQTYSVVEVIKRYLKLFNTSKAVLILQEKRINVKQLISYFKCELTVKYSWSMGLHKIKDTALLEQGTHK